MSDKKLKTVLIISYYWPPAGGPGVQRVLKFAKYLPQFGWRPIILTVRNGEYPAIDNSLMNEVSDDIIVRRTNSFEPSGLYRKFVGMKNDEAIPVAVLTENNPSLKKRISNWIRANLFIPDAKIGWIPLAILKGKKIIRKYKPDLILSSSPPPTVQLIARRLAKYGNIPWIADFRDPWTDIYHYDSVNKLRLAKWIDKKLEQKALKSANHVVTVSEGFKFLLKQKTSLNGKISIITNGYDPADFQEMKNLEKFDRFTLAYSGKISIEQNPSHLWITLGKLVRTDHDFQSRFQLLLMGNISHTILEEIENCGLSENLFYSGYLPHRELIKNLLRSHSLLLLIPMTRKNDGIIPGKVFEYIATGNEIIGIGNPHGDAAKIIESTGSGKMFEPDFDIFPVIHQQFEQWKNGHLHKSLPENIKQYSRAHQAMQLTQIMKNIINPKRSCGNIIE